MALHPQTAMAMGQILHRLAGNPKTRDVILPLVKQVQPDYRLPADVEIKNLKEELAAERAKEKNEEQKQRNANRRARERATLVESHGEDVVKEIEALVAKNPKYEKLDLADAAKIYASEDGPATPSGRRPETTRHGMRWEFPDIPGLMANPDKAAQDMAYSIIDSFRGKPAG